MELKHLIIAAIVANAAKSGRPAAPGSLPALTNAILQDARPSYGVFASLPNCLESPPAPCREDRKKTTSAVFHLLTRFFSLHLCPPRRFHATHGECFGNTCLGHEWRQCSTCSGEKCNPLRIQRAAAPELSGIRAGWRCTALGPCSTASGHQPTDGWRADKVLNRCLRASTADG